MHCISPIYSSISPIYSSISPVYSSIFYFIGGLEGIRPVIIPGDTVSRFQQLASANTRRDIETCGILAGKLVRGFLLNIICQSIYQLVHPSIDQSIYP